MHDILAAVPTFLPVAYVQNWQFETRSLDNARRGVSDHDAGVVHCRVKPRAPKIFDNMELLMVLRRLFNQFDYFGRVGIGVWIGKNRWLFVVFHL